MDTFQITAVDDERTATLTLHGEADVAVADEIVESGTRRLTDGDVDTVVIDLGGVTFMDSTAIGALVRLHNVADTAGKHLALVNVPARVRKILTITGLLDLFGLPVE
jgi:anti-sigma B factor antagonist